MSDTWKDIQELKSRRSGMREKLLKRKKEREGLVADIQGTAASPGAPTTSAQDSSSSPAAISIKSTASPSPIIKQLTQTEPEEEEQLPIEIVNNVEEILHRHLSDVALEFPVEASTLASMISRKLERKIPLGTVDNLLQKFAAQQLISISSRSADHKANILTVTSADQAKLAAFTELGECKTPEPDVKKRKLDVALKKKDEQQLRQQKQGDNKDESIESLLSMQSSKERQNKKVLEEIQLLLSKPTAKEQSIVEKFRSQGGAQVQEFCQYGTHEECMRSTNNSKPCEKLHFKKIISRHTDESLGDCSFLNTCFHMDTCKYVHYEIHYPENTAPPKVAPELPIKVKPSDGATRLYPPQWVQCDVRAIDMTVLGKFSVVMADPPWDIHMELPYGTMSDDEMRKMDVCSLQDDGFIFLWVTGRAMELGRECLQLWGYESCDELIWVKTNQLQRIIRTGRTGHWLNHGKEHCLIGRKGNPVGMNVGLDCDVIVAEVRATSHKPDEIYGIIERLAPGLRKVELFGRPHNVQPNWVTLGNQLDGVRLLEPEVVKAFKKRYPDGNCFKS